MCLVQVVLLVEGEDVLVLDQEELSWLVSLGAVGAVVGHLAGGVRVDRLGWRGAALLTCPLFIMGFLLSGLSKLTQDPLPGQAGQQPLLHSLGLGHLLLLHRGHYWEQMFEHL